MDKKSLTILKADIEAQVREIENIYTKLKERKQAKGTAGTESVAYQLHNLYCAFEDLFKIIANAFENHIQDTIKYHAELLKRMAIPIEGVRPPLFSRESYILLDNLRSFRHVFRHAYACELDIRKIHIVLEDVGRLKELYPRDIKAFLDSFLC